MGIFDIFKNDSSIDGIEVEIEAPHPFPIGVKTPIKITINNLLETPVNQIELYASTPLDINLEQHKIKINNIPPKSSETVNFFATRKKHREFRLGYLDISYKVQRKKYKKESIRLGLCKAHTAEIDVKIEVQNPLKVGIENPIKIRVNNFSDKELSDIKFTPNFPKLIKSSESSEIIENIPAKTSKSTAIFVTPRVADKIDLGMLNVSYKMYGDIFEQEPINIGIYEATDDIYQSTINSDNINSDLSISRETEFYQGFIRFKMSVTNSSSFVVNDVALEFDFDDNSLRIDRHEPDYQFKNGKIIVGNIAGNSSKTVAVYFDPMICSKGTDINCLATYKDAKGQLQTTQMKPKSISVVCPIMRTDSDINVGRLKELVGKLPYRDSKVYQIQTHFDAEPLINISREVVQKHDVKHVRTLSTKESETFELWYYGKTKVNNHDIVIRITISGETQSVELFAAMQTPESLAGLLAEVGRELKGEIESKTTGRGNVQQVINLSIKDSIIQRSNLLSSCDINGDCTGDVVIVDSLVQRSDIGSSNVNNCPNCGKDMSEGDLFCSGCGTKIGESNAEVMPEDISITSEENNIPKTVCPSCNSEYTDSANFCLECGTKLGV